MYCPKCSQQQVSPEMRFCSRCGFPLDGVRELIASGGILVAPEMEAQIAPPTRGRKRVRRGAWVMLASFALMLIVLLLSAIDSELINLMLLPVLTFVVGFIIMLFGVLFGKSAAVGKRNALRAPATTAAAVQPGTAARIPELSPSRATPVEAFTARRIETAEMVQPPSVTDHTTRLLDEEPDSRRG